MEKRDRERKEEEREEKGRKNWKVGGQMKMIGRGMGVAS